MLPRPSGVVCFLTDFGARDPYVGLMKGMTLRACPRATLVDLTHDVEAQDVALGAFFLAQAIGRFPAGTVHVAVVDPSTAAQRRVLCAVAHEGYWIGPDNGVLGEVLAGGAYDVRSIDFEALGLVPASRTFHGRDVYAPLAGGLAGGRFGYAAVGPRCGDPVRRDPLLGGDKRVVHVDAHGNLVTNVPAAAIATARMVHVGGRAVPVRGASADAQKGSLVALVNSYDLVEIVENQGSAAATLRLGRGAPVALEP